MDFIPIQTKAALLHKEKQDFNVTIFEPMKMKANNRAFAKTDQKMVPVDDQKSDEDGIEDIFADARRRKRMSHKEESRIFDISSARKEVINFGISGLDKATKHEANVALAIKLGAKPPKNKYRNYKEILEERRKEKHENDRSNRRKKGQSFGAARSYQQQKQRQRVKASNPQSVTRHYGVVNPRNGK